MDRSLGRGASGTRRGGHGAGCLGRRRQLQPGEGDVWPRADAAIWLAYPLRTILTRVLSRTLRRVFTQEELWNGNRERFFRSVFGRESIIRWALRTYRTRRREYPAVFARPEYAQPLRRPPALSPRRSAVAGGPPGGSSRASERPRGWRRVSPFSSPLSASGLGPSWRHAPVLLPSDQV